MRTFVFLSLTTLAFVFNGFSAEAKNVKSADHKAIASKNTQPLSSRMRTASDSNFLTNPATLTRGIPVAPVVQPIPGTVLTSASSLKLQPSETVAQLDTTTPGTNIPGTTTPGTTTPGTITPGTTTPGTTTPGTTTPGTITPGTTTPGTTTPGTTTPGTTTPGTTIPGTTTPGTTIPGTTIPGTTTPGTTIPGTTTPGTTIPGTTTPGTTTPGTTTPGTTRPGFSLGRATRSGSSYVGIGGNIGLGTGNTAVGDGSFSAFSKIGLTRNFSVRPAILATDNPTLLIPITYDFAPIALPGVGFSVAPYVGVGPAISFGDNASADFLVSGGIDIPLSSRFTATAAVNATPIDNGAVGLTIGIGYNFSGF